MTETRCFIVRHGNTFHPGEIVRRCGCRTDIELTSEGIAQADLLAVHFATAGIRFDRVLAAPLARTWQTAERISLRQSHAAVIEPGEWLTEIDHGPDENMSEAAVERRVGRAALAAWNAAGIPPQGWRVDPARIVAAWQAFFAAAHGTILLVTSNGIARFALLALCASPRATTLTLRTGAFGRIDRMDDGSFHVIGWDMRPTLVGEETSGSRHSGG